ncbi:MAG TPA: MauE/DoxX family redox-associated membrane protein [Acidimicrobiales bacterium]|nr:MauE/DoxX family redox-associated membrane protein [Acidimicrobiales bacterium]
MNAPAVASPYLASVALLGVAGLAKVARPKSTVLALRQAGFPATRTAVRGGAVAETAVAVASLVAPGAVTGALVAGCYSAFTAFTVVALRMRWPISSCGCFGKPDTLPTKAHAFLNAGAVVSAVWWAVGRPANVDRVFSGQPWHGAPLGLTTAVVALLAYIVWTNPVPSVSGGEGP